jgi:hypothetical protein
LCEIKKYFYFTWECRNYVKIFVMLCRFSFVQKLRFNAVVLMFRIDCYLFWSNPFVLHQQTALAGRWACWYKSKFSIWRDELLIYWQLKRMKCWIVEHKEAKKRLMIFVIVGLSLCFMSFFDFNLQHRFVSIVLALMTFLSFIESFCHFH